MTETMCEDCEGTGLRLVEVLKTIEEECGGCSVHDINEAAYLLRVIRGHAGGVIADVLKVPSHATECSRCQGKKVHP